MLVETFEKIITELTKELSCFNEDQFNSVPFEGSWTAGQVAQHLFLSYSGAPKFLAGPVENTERDFAEHLTALEHIFLNFSKKLNAPDFIIPEKKNYDQHEMITAINNVKDNIVEVVRNVDLSMTCTGFTLPVLGALTRTEWIFFMTVHTERHIQQLKNIREALIKE